MSMSNKTTNEFFNIGTNADVFSLFDFNANFEKADNLINTLQNTDKENTTALESLKSTVNDIKSNVDTLLVNNSNLTQTVTKQNKELTSLSTNLTNAKQNIANLEKTVPLKQDKIIGEIQEITTIGNWCVIRKTGYVLLNCYLIRDDLNYTVTAISKRSEDYKYTVLINGTNNTKVSLYCVWAKI